MFGSAFAAIYGAAHNHGQTRYPTDWRQPQRSGNVRPHQGEAEAQRRRNQQARNLANQLDRGRTTTA